MSCFIELLLNPASNFLFHLLFASLKLAFDDQETLNMNMREQELVSKKLLILIIERQACS